jgi:hypothetical protein
MIRSTSYQGGEWPEGDPQKRDLDARNAEAARRKALHASEEASKPKTRSEEIRAAFADNDRVTFVTRPESGFVSIFIDGREVDKGWWPSDDGTDAAAPASKVIAAIVYSLLAKGRPVTTLEAMRVKYAVEPRVSWLHMVNDITAACVDGVPVFHFDEGSWDTLDECLAAIDAALAKPTPAQAVEAFTTALEPVAKTPRDVRDAFLATLKPEQRARVVVIDDMARSQVFVDGRRLAVCSDWVSAEFIDSMLEDLETALAKPTQAQAVGLECPCCGDIAARPDARGFYIDGQPITCGCGGHVTLDAETPPWVNVEGECAPQAGCQEPTQAQAVEKIGTECFGGTDDPMAVESTLPKWAREQPPKEKPCNCEQAQRLLVERDRLAARVQALEACVTAVCDQASRVLNGGAK